VDVSYGNMLLEFSAMFATTHGLQPSQATQPPFELLPKESCGSLRRRFEATEHTAVGCAAGGALPWGGRAYLGQQRWRVLLSR
jgi:hypothetical protein